MGHDRVRGWGRGLVAVVACMAALAACGRAKADTERHGADSAARAAARPALSPRAHAEMLAIKESMDSLTPEVGRMQSAAAAAQHGMLADHERLARAFLARIDTRIADIHTPVDPAFTALVDSVRTDLDRMPAMAPAPLHAYLPAHLGRLMHIVSCIDTYGL